MASISISYETCGTAPRTLFDILHTQEDAEASVNSLGDLFDAEYDQYIKPMRAPESKSTLLS